MTLGRPRVSLLTGAPLSSLAITLLLLAFSSILSLALRSEIVINSSQVGDFEEVHAIERFLYDVLTFRFDVIVRIRYIFGASAISDRSI